MNSITDGQVKQKRGRVALITGGSRGIGAETARVLAEHRYDVVLTYRNKVARANEVIADVRPRGVRGLALPCDLTHTEDVESFFHYLKQWTQQIDILVLNASGGLERELVAADSQYAMHINRDAQLQFVDAALPFLRSGSVIVFITSHWAHLYGQIEQVPAYEPVAVSKYAGEQALRARQDELASKGIRLVVVTGDLIEGTITPKLLERTAPGLLKERRTRTGALPTAAEMGREIALSALNVDLPTGTTIVVGEALEALIAETQQ